MNIDASALARYTFVQAAKPGPLHEPISVAAVLLRPEAHPNGIPLDVEAFVKALDEEFPWRNQLVFQSRQPNPAELKVWIEVVRWLMQSLIASSTNATEGTLRVQVLFTALGVLDVGHEGMNAVSDYFVGSQIPAKLVAILQRVQLVPEGIDAQSLDYMQTLKNRVRAGDFKMLKLSLGRLQPNLSPDISTFIFMLWKLEPDELTGVINRQDSIPFDLLTCMVLDKDAPLFALQVDRVAFKFISQSWLSEADPFGIHKQLLLQVAETPYWKGWLQAKYEHPAAAGAEQSQVLAEVLAQLSEPQWKDFIFALELSKSKHSVEAVTEILVQATGTFDSIKAYPIWLMAFERWDAWDYGKHEKFFFLSSPQVCSFDFPVAMYYSHMKAADRYALERELQHAIAHVEQQWFASDSELCTERNRLSSRLRLVRHGIALATGGTEALPPQVQPDSEYSEVRYRYHEI